MSKGGSANIPTYAYAQTYQSNVDAANIAAQTSREQLDWAKQQYADMAPYTKAYMQNMSDSMTQNLANAQADRARYEKMFQPVEDKFVSTAQSYASPARAQQESAAAQADVNQAFSAQRAAALQNLEGYGIDPSQTRYGALDLGARISQAAASAAAGTQARKNTEATGLALQGEAINIGRGYPGQVAQSYGTAQGAGAAGIQSGLSTSSTYGNLMGTPTQWSAQQGSFLNNAGNNVNSYTQAQLGQAQMAAQAGAGTSQGIGSLVGAAAMAAAIAFSDRRVKTDIRRIGKTDRGIPVVTYRYKGEPKGALHVGVIAQDVEKKIPEAVLRHPTGLKLVDYSKVA